MSKYETMKNNQSFILILALFLFNSSFSQTFTLVKDVQKGSMPSNPNEFKVFNGKLYFVADDGIHGIEPWVSDGTDTGTKLFMDIFPGPKGSKPIFFNYTSNYNFYEYKGKLYFCAKDSLHGSDLWVSDGTPNGTKMLKEIDTTIYWYPNTAGVYFGGVSNNKLIFVAYEDSNGPEPWVTDGTDTGTYLLKDIAPGNDGSYPNNFTLYNGLLYFSANNPLSQGGQLYVTDGTKSGTRKVTHVANSSNGWGPDEMIVFNNKIFLTAFDPNIGAQIYNSDGTDTGTKMISKRDTTHYGFYPKHLFVYNNSLYFSAHDSNHGVELWVTDGTKNGEHLFVDINPGKDSSMPSDFFIYNSKLYFTANDGAHGFELWVSDGTSAGTHIVKDLNPGKGGSASHNFTLYNNQIYFVASDTSNGISLAVSDGTYLGTTLLGPSFAVNSNPLLNNNGIVPFNNSLYFNANYTSTNNELWSIFDTTFHTSISIENINKISVRCYPDPLSGQMLNLEFGNISEGTLKIQLHSMDGKIIMQDQIKSPGKQLQIQIPENISNGIYILQIFTQNESYCQKIIIQH